MTEDFLIYLWKYKLIDAHQSLTSGESIELIDPGTHNKNSGPDFFNARIKIGPTLWAGNVEMHIAASGWEKHGHQNDLAYDNVILHVVFLNDRDVFRKNGEPIPTLELKAKVDLDLLSVYQQLMLNKNWIPCAHLITYASRFVIHSWLDRMIVCRLDRKGEEIAHKLSMENNDWKECFYQSLAKNFGFMVNSIPFELLAKSISLSILAKHKDNLLQLEALLFGQAGLLEGRYRNKYFLTLKKEYAFLAKKYHLIALDSHLWQFMRMRPSNFPTLRISQFAALIYQSSFLFSKILELNKLDEFEELFGVQASAFWDSHYTFKTSSKYKVKKIGKHGIHLLLINTIVPYLYTYGKIKKNSNYCEKALKLLEQVKGESNVVTRNWQKLGLPTGTAYQTQALLELKTSFCRRKLCLECGIGNSILNVCKE